ncbi:signal peptide peptidase SppA [Candidatus Woesearchaeota archaeon]|nr:signal peptide peptidase SppA [Candidatus Woesearchaeota archaeon]
MKKNNHHWGKIILFLLLLWLLSSIVSSFFKVSSGGTSTDLTGNVAIIKVYGTIRSTSSDGFAASGISSNDLVELLDSVDRDPSVKAVVLDINSGGGSAVGSDEIGQKVASMKKPTVAWIREIGASGAYWIASNTDHIVANRMSIVGSIGVIGSYLEIANFLEDHNVTYRRFVSGKFKDSGSPLKELTNEEEDLIQSLLNEIYDEFVLEIAVNRNLSVKTVESLATGEVFTGAKGVELGLIDEVGGIDEVTAYLEGTYNITVDYKLVEKQESFQDILRKLVSQQSFSIGRGIGSFLNIDNQIVYT